MHAWTGLTNAGVVRRHRQAEGRVDIRTPFLPHPASPLISALTSTSTGALGVGSRMYSHTTTHSYTWRG